MVRVIGRRDANLNHLINLKTLNLEINISFSSRCREPAWFSQEEELEQILVNVSSPPSGAFSPTQNLDTPPAVVGSLLQDTTPAVSSLTGHFSIDSAVHSACPAPIPNAVFSFDFVKKHSFLSSR